MNWETIELLGYSYYSSKGYSILIKLVSNSNYDFVAERDGTYIKVNVKRAGLKSKSIPTSWSISQASGSNPLSKTRENKPKVDVYLVWLPHLEKFIELPGDFFEGANSKSKIIPKKYLK
ncbi:group I intron-associated PD-(D/E)XK endonuclease [Paenibacillus sp. FSL P2-0322]|uniref:group I intron-associated PD-(D/E)XK endonuclease n=1 Tax=Paenibacillus sp. FSL P2-0322 TaxID=2921628 RepID=UPI0030D15911